MLPSRSVDALDPERPEIPLLLLAVTVRMLPTLFDRVFGRAVQVLAPAKVPFGRLEDLLLSMIAGNRTL
jgi:hypothetical protein